VGGGGEKKTEKEKKTGLDYSKWDNLDVDDAGEVRPSGSETGWYLRLIDFVYHSTLGLRVTMK